VEDWRSGQGDDALLLYAWAACCPIFRPIEANLNAVPTPIFGELSGHVGAVTQDSASEVGIRLRLWRVSRGGRCDRRGRASA